MTAYATDATAIDTLTIDQIAAFDAGTLASIDGFLASEGQALTSRKAKLQAALERRYGEAITKALAEKKSDTGTFHLSDPSSNAVGITVTVGKKVEWNQKALLAALDAMPPEAAKHYGKAKFTVEEKKFTAAPPDVQKTLLSARTVKTDKPKFEFKQEAEAA